MSYNALTSGEIASGKPVTNSLATKIKDNFDNHETRISNIENGTIVSYPPIIMRISGQYDFMATEERVAALKTTANFALQITGIRILIDKAGASGTTSVDILKKSGVGAYVSVLTAQPTVAYTAGDDAISTDAVLDPTKVTLAAGDIIRLDITSVQTDGNGFLVRIDYQKVG